MDAFLYTVANNIYDRFGKELHRIAVVFPNRRQAVFFKDYLQQTVAPPAFLPQLLTIEELIQRSTLYPIADGFVQSFSLYDAYVETMLDSGNGEPLDYEKFYTIGDILLREFQELDAYLANVDQVYEQLKDIEGIEKSFDSLTDEQKEFLQNFWSAFSSEKKSVQQQKFLDLWSMLPNIYRLFHQKLSALNLVTLGMAYRQLATKTATRANFADGWSHVAFVGFNAFNKAEESLLSQWQALGKASLWMDADEHYTNNPQHEAGHFIRRNLQRLQLKNELPLIDRIGTAAIPIQVISAPGAIAQTKLLSQWLDIYANNEKKSLAIILADEGLLIPVLQSLPSDLGNINVTMGYPLQQSALFSFIQLFFAIQMDMAVHHGRDVAHEHVQAFLQHPLCDWPDNAKQQLRQRIVNEVLLRIPQYFLMNHSSTGNYIFSHIDKPIAIFDRLVSMMEDFHGTSRFGHDHLLEGLLVQVWQTIRQLKALFAASALPLSLSFLTASLRKQLATISVPFEGEPLQGIQVMGLLESRGLDFDHIIILSANEGALPRIQAPNSFLPDSIRRAFGLRVPENQDAIFAYAFYRLLHRCQHMTMVYNATINDQSTGEVSRFVPQLEFETRFVIKKNTMRFALKSNTVPPITIQKNIEVLKLFNPYFLGEKPKTFSPSAINSYIHCQLQFYFRYIARLKEPDEIQDEVDAAVFGNIVHNLMELLYEAVKEKNSNWRITQEDIAWMKTQVPLLLPTAFIKGWREKSKDPIAFTGRLLVVSEVVKQYANAYLDHDATHVPFEIEALETDFKEAIQIELNGKYRPIYFSGYIDRIDIVKGVNRMVDYKTGADELEFTTIEKLFDRNEKKRNKAALQTLIYAWSFSKKFPDKKRFEPALLPMRVMQQKGENFSPRFISKISRTEKATIDADYIPSALQELEIHLKKLLEELFDAKVPFAQVEDWDKCTYCPYIGICGRE